MADDNSKNKKRREKEAEVLEKVAQVVASIYEAKHVDNVICALHSLAVLLFSLDSSSVSDTVGEQYRDQVINANVPSVEERREWWGAFYKGAAFPTIARVLLNNVASNWLACFPFSASKNIYDVFFVNGDIMEVVQTVVPFLQKSSFGSSDVCSNAGRRNLTMIEADIDGICVLLLEHVTLVLILCLLDNNGLLQMAREFGALPKLEEIDKLVISRLVQLVTSIPDKAHSVVLKTLSSHIYYKQSISQLLSGAEEFDSNMRNNALVLDDNGSDGSLLFIGEVLARICRRGSADILLSEMVTRILGHVRSALSSDSDLTTSEVFELKPGSLFWMNIIKAIKDPFAVEKMSEHLLRHLEAAHVSDVEAYWTLWILFKEVLTHKASIRAMFVEKFLLWKVFPICCLRWIIQFAILEFPPGATKSHDNRELLSIVQHLAAAWCRRELVQSFSMEQQAYITAALGLTLEKMSKEDLDATKDVMQSILEGVSCRLESPSHLVRKMASGIALVFSRIIDPNNPLYLDDSFQDETIDWEFGLANREKGTFSTIKLVDDNVSESEATDLLLREKNLEKEAESDKRNVSKARKTRLSEFNLVDPDEVIDPAVLNSELGSDEENDEDDDSSRDSETSSHSSLQPYDLSDDDADLKPKISQLVDVVGALRKSDDADGVDRALDVAEKLIRASPNELRYIASDLVRILVQVRCCDSAVDGEEESAEEKRQKALVALISTSPFESLDTVGNLLYSPNLDISQRIMILDIMTYAAQELGDAKITKPKNHANKILVSDASDAQPWFLPSNVGPTGAGPWKAISRNDTPLNWSYSYERELPVRSIQVSRGKTRRWSLKSESTSSNETEQSRNRFPQYAAAFMLPAMRGFDKKRQGVNLIERDFIVLGKLIYMLGVCMKCAAMHPEASALAPALIDMLSTREVCHHAEAYVRRSVIFAASCILVAIHPSFVASSLLEGNTEISKGLEWIREWALRISDSDPDRECYTLAIACLQLHSELALQTSRALETIRTRSSSISVSGLSSNPFKGEIKVPRGSLEF